MLKIFLRPAEIAHDVANLAAGSEHLGNRTQAKVEAVIRAFLNRDEPSDPRRCPARARCPGSLGPHARVVGMAGGSNLVFVADGDHAVEEIRDPLPGGSSETSGPRERRISRASASRQVL